jgi:hypothetical protein
MHEIQKTNRQLSNSRENLKLPHSIKEAVTGLNFSADIKRRGIGLVRADIVDDIGRVIEFYNVARSFNNSQIAFLADLIIASHPFLTINELTYCFSQQMAYSEYGRVYERLDGSVIMDWISQYCTQRNEACEIEAQQISDVLKSDGDSFFEEHLKELKQKAAKGDKEAKELIDFWENGYKVNQPEKEHCVYRANNVFDDNKKYWNERQKQHDKRSI